MLVSTEHKFVFLSNRKCASSSLVHSLKPYCSVVFESDQRVRHTNFKEYRKYILPFLKHKVGDEVKGYDVFCLFREPTDWLHSWYRFRTRSAVSPEVTPGHWEYAGHRTWPEFMADCFKWNSPRYAVRTRQWKFVTAKNRKVDGITLVRYDDIDAFTKLIGERVGQEIDVVRWNVSPKADSGPSDDDRLTCRKNMARDYEIYDAIKPLE